MHIMPQDDTNFNMARDLRGISRKLAKKFGKTLLDKLCYRVRCQDEPFELLHTGKRSVFALLDEGLSGKCVKARDHYA
jgi:hypothetical protein